MKYVLGFFVIVGLMFLVGCQRVPEKQPKPMTEEQKQAQVESQVWTDPKYGCQYFMGGYGIMTLRQGSC